MSNRGRIYLIPCPLGEVPPNNVLPLSISKVVESIDHYVVEHEKMHVNLSSQSARAKNNLTFRSIPLINSLISLIYRNSSILVLKEPISESLVTQAVLESLIRVQKL